MMMTTLTEQDVRDAMYADATKRHAHIEGTTPEAIIRELANTRQEAEEGIAQFQRGARLLKDYMVVMSDRSTAGGILKDERVVSPIVQAFSGHIATAEAYRAVGLVQR